MMYKIEVLVLDDERVIACKKRTFTFSENNDLLTRAISFTDKVYDMDPHDHKGFEIWEVADVRSAQRRGVKIYGLNKELIEMYKDKIGE